MQRIKRFFLTDLVKITSWTGIATTIRLASQFITAKILAIFVGPAGLAIMGQLSNVANVFQTLASGGITVGVTKYVAEFAEEKKKQEEIIANSFKVIFYCSLICTTFLVIGYKYIGHLVFNSNKYNYIILIFGVTLILLTFNNVFIAIINGLKQFRKYVVINIATSIINLTLTLIFVRFWGVPGALITFVLSPAIIFFVSFFSVYRNAWLNPRFVSMKFDFKVLKKLSVFSLMVINNAVVGSIGQIVIRSLITNKISLDMAGIWDGMNRLSGAYFLILTTSIQVYYLPTLSAILKPDLLWKEIIKTEKIIIPIVFIMFLLIFLFRGLIIDVLFTKQFYAMKELFLLQLIADIIKIAAWIISYTMYAKAMAKQLIITDNLFTLTFIALIYFSIDRLGLKSIYYSNIVVNLIYLVVIYFFLKRHILKQQKSG